MVFYPSCRREAGRRKKSKRNEKKLNFLLTNISGYDKIAMFRSSERTKERVPCKLNNERNEKHQTEHIERCALNELGEAGLSQLPAELSIKSF